MINHYLGIIHVLRNHVLGVFWPPPICDYLICTWMIPNTNLSNLDFSQGASGHTLVRHETVFWRLHYVCDIAEQRRAGCRRSRPRISSEKRAAQVLRLRFHSHFCRGVHPQSKPLLFLFQFTLPRKILLCPINWGTQWTMEISSNE